MGEYSRETRLFTKVAYTIDNHNVSLSEGGALAVVVESFHETARGCWGGPGGNSPPVGDSKGREPLASPK